MTTPNISSILGFTHCRMILALIAVTLTGTLCHISTRLLEESLSVSNSSGVSKQSSGPRQHDLLCVCGKGGTCLDRSVDIPKIPRGADECRCHISKGYYEDCDRIVDHCKTTVCLNGGECVRTFGGFYCICERGFFGSKCEGSSTNDLQFSSNSSFSTSKLVQFPMTFNFIHTTANESKKLYLAVQNFGESFEVFVDFNDGRELLRLRKIDFEFRLNLGELCMEKYHQHPEVHDLQACEVLENIFSNTSEPFFVAVIEPSYPLRVYQVNDTGRVDAISLSVRNNGVVTFKQILTFFTPFYGVHNEVNDSPCQYKIEFRGCGLYYNSLRNYRASDGFIVNAITIPVRKCHPIRKRIGYWRYYPNDSSIFIEKRDEGLTLKAFFESFAFKPGRRWIEYHLKEIGDAKFYGLSNELISKGKADCISSIYFDVSSVKCANFIRKNRIARKPLPRMRGIMKIS